MSIFEVALESFIDMNHELVLLSKQIDWEAVESEFAEYYCADNGRPSVPIRKTVGMMLLKNITFPTDAKLYRKIIAKVLKMARKEDIELRQTYTRELKALKLKVRVMNHPTRMKEGKEHKKYEFGNKSAIAKTRSGLIVNALAFIGNPYDGHTISAHLEQAKRLTGFVDVRHTIVKTIVTDIETEYTYPHRLEWKDI